MNRRNTVEAETLYVLAPNVTIGKDEDDEVTVFDARHGRYWRGNCVAKDILQLLERPISIQNITDSVHARFDADRNTILSDTRRIVTELRAAKLVRTARA